MGEAGGAGAVAVAEMEAEGAGTVAAGETEAEGSGAVGAGAGGGSVTSSEDSGWSTGARRKRASSTKTASAFTAAVARSRE